jgi:hypothetical protein
MAKWWHVSWKRAAIALLIVFSALWMLAEAGMQVSHQLEPWILTRTAFRDDSNLDLVPITLPDRSVASMSGMVVETYGFSFQIPWKDGAKAREEDNVYVVGFPGAKVGVLAFNPTVALNSARMMGLDPKVARILGEETVRSNYDLMAAEMETTREQVRWWRTPKHNARCFMLLGMKSMALSDSTALYAVNFGQVRGFQEGNPAQPPYRVHLDLFDAADQHYEIQISAHNSRPALTQAEANAIVASLRPIPHS